MDLCSGDSLFASYFSIFLYSTPSIKFAAIIFISYCTKTAFYLFSSFPTMISQRVTTLWHILCKYFYLELYIIIMSPRFLVIESFIPKRNEMIYERGALMKSRSEKEVFIILDRKEKQNEKLYVLYA